MEGNQTNYESFAERKYILYVPYVHFCMGGGRLSKHCLLLNVIYSVFVRQTKIINCPVLIFFIKHKKSISNQNGFKDGPVFFPCVLSGTGHVI